MEYLVTVLWFLGVVFAAYFAHNVWSGMLGRAYWVFMAPGVAVHELSHAVACLITGAKIHSLRLFGPAGGEVEHGPPRLKFGGQLLISMAPVVGCTAALGLVGWLLDSSIASSIKAAPMNFEDGPAVFLAKSWDTIWGLARTLSRADYTSWKTYAFIYAAVCFGISLKPSGRDFKNAAQSIVILGVIVGVAHLIMLQASYPNTIVKCVLNPVQTPLRFLISFLGLVALITLIVWLIRCAIHHFTGSNRNRTRVVRVRDKSSPPPKS